MTEFQKLTIQAFDPVYIEAYYDGQRDLISCLRAAFEQRMDLAALFKPMLDSLEKAIETNRENEVPEKPGEE